MKGFRKFAKSTRKGMSAAYGSSRKRERR